MTGRTIGGEECAAVMLGGSAGSLEPLVTILRQLPASFAAPLVVVIHSPEGEPSLLARALGPSCVLAVREAEDKEALMPGTVLVAPAGYHLLVETTATVALSVAPPEHFSRPSIDIAFSSAALALGPRCVAVLLSGANEDGARGLGDVHGAGGLALVQSPDEAASPMMPQAGLAACPAALALPACDLGQQLSLLPKHRHLREAP